MGVEIENAKEAFRLARKETPKHVSLVLGVFALSCKKPELGKVARASYFFMRHMDDVLDGDSQVRSDPLSYALDVREQIETGDFYSEPSIATLAQYSIKTLSLRATSEDEPRKEFLRAMDSMIFDFERSRERRVLSEQELNSYYWETFSPVINILLIGLKSKFRAADIPALSVCQGRLYTIRDLLTDWQRGTINIPQTVLYNSGLASDSTLKELTESEKLQGWFSEEAKRSQGELLTLQEQLRNCGEDLTYYVCNRLIKWMLRFSENT